MPSPSIALGTIVALALIVVIAAVLIRRAGSGLRDQLKAKQAAGPMLSKAEVEAITSRGLATPEQLIAMKPNEQQMLAATAMMLVTASQKAAGGARPAGPGPDSPAR